MVSAGLNSFDGIRIKIEKFEYFVILPLEVDQNA